LTESSSSEVNPEDSFYASDPLEGDLLYQGEVIIDTPILTMPQPTRWLLLRTQSGKPVDAALDYGKGVKENRVRVLDSNQFSPEWTTTGSGDFVMGILDKSPAMIVSQNCNIDTKDYVQVAPIIPVDPSDAEYVENIKEHKMLSFFYMAPRPPLWDTPAYVDFNLIQSIHKTYIKRIPAENHFRLSAANVIQLQRNLTRFFGRPNAYDANADTVPRDGTYLCVQCFYMGAKATAVSLNKGGKFNICDQCGGVGWVPKIGDMPGA